MIFDSTTSAVLPLIGVGLGWLLSELGLYLRDRRANKKVFGQAILQLLEIREAVQFKRRVATLAKAYAKQGHVDRAASLREAKPESLNDCLAALSSIKKEISSIDPFLAFDLQSRLDGLMLGLQSSAIDGSASDEMLGTVEAILRESVADELKLFVLRLAWRKNVYSYLKARKHFKAEKALHSRTESNAEKIVVLTTTLKGDRRLTGSKRNLFDQ